MSQGGERGVEKSQSLESNDHEIELKSRAAKLPAKMFLLARLSSRLKSRGRVFRNFIDSAVASFRPARVWVDPGQANVCFYHSVSVPAVVRARKKLCLDCLQLRSDLSGEKKPFDNVSAVNRCER